MHSSSARKEPVVVVFAADERYAIPLAAAVRSVLDNASRDRGAHIYIFDCGLGDEALRRLNASWTLGPGQRVIWKDAPASRIEHLPVWGCYGASVYCRLLIPEMIAHARRAIYLDSDVLVLGDLSELFHHDLEGHPLGAVPDAGMPFADEDIHDCRNLGLEPNSPYLNSGVLLMDLERWRAEDIGSQVMDCIRRKREWIQWADQDALNVTLAGRWMELSPRWNAFMGYIPPRCPPRCPIVAARYAEIKGLPEIGHFVAIHKPWEPECDLFARRLFMEYLDRTGWAGWRPKATVRLRPFPPALPPAGGSPTREAANPLRL